MPARCESVGYLWPLRAANFVCDNGLTWLFQIIMFILLGLLVNPHEMLEDGDTLKEISLPEGALVMIVKRYKEFLVPNGSLHLQVGDKLLLISEGAK